MPGTVSLGLLPYLTLMFNTMDHDENPNIYVGSIVEYLIVKTLKSGTGGLSISTTVSPIFFSPAYLAT